MRLLRRRRGRRLLAMTKTGSVLIFALWVMVFLGMLAAAAGARARTQVTVVQRVVARVQTRIASYSAISYVAQLIKNHSEAAEAQGGALVSAKNDAQKKLLWFNDPERFHDLPLDERGGLFSVGYYGGKDGREFIFGLEDEGTRININSVSQEVFKRMYLSLPLMTEAKAAELAQATVDWRSRKADFLEFGHKTGGRGAGFGSPEELQMVPGFDLSLWDHLKDRITVYGAGKINMNTAPVATLVLAGINESLAQRISQFRETAAPPAFTDLGDLTQKIGVLPSENQELANISAFLSFEPDAFRFISVVSGPGALSQGRFECGIDLKGNVLWLRES